MNRINNIEKLTVLNMLTIRNLDRISFNSRPPVDCCVFVHLFYVFNYS